MSSFRILASFIRTQLKVFFPLRDENDVQLYVKLISLVTSGLSCPSIRSEILLLYSISFIYGNTELNPLPQAL